jgi:flavin reductase (DIM6/NTAB) family NADH-FMN oxidoreductase RutF
MVRTFLSLLVSAFEHFNKLTTNDLRLVSGSLDAFKSSPKLINRINNDFGVQFINEHLHDHVAFMHATGQHPVTQRFAASAVNQGSSHDESTPSIR